MKNNILPLFLATLICSTSFAEAAQTLIYPEAKPLVAFDVPEDWKAEFKKDGRLFVVPPGEDDSTIVEVLSLESGLDDFDGAMEEAMETISEFENITSKEGEGAETETLKIRIFNIKGEDKHGPAFINFVLLAHQKAKTHILLSMISTPDGFAQQAEAIKGILESIGTVTPAPDKAAMKEKGPTRGEVATYSYPDKDAAAFTMDFPAAWTQSPTDEGVHVVSDDKLVGMNVLFIDIADVDVAVEAMKKKIGADYASIKWNYGGDPQVMKDDDSGVTTIYNMGEAMDGDTKYCVNFTQVAKKGGEKFLLLITQAPEEVVFKTHAEAIMKVSLSIKAK